MITELGKLTTRKFRKLLDFMHTQPDKLFDGAELNITVQQFVEKKGLKL